MNYRIFLIKQFRLIRKYLTLKPDGAKLLSVLRHYAIRGTLFDAGFEVANSVYTVLRRHLQRSIYCYFRLRND